MKRGGGGSGDWIPKVILKSMWELIKFKRGRGDYRQNDQYGQK